MRIFYVQNKHTILIYSLEPPTTTQIGGFFFTQRKQWEAQVKKILLVAGMLCCPIVAHAAFNGGSITDCAILECPDGYLANLITCECVKQGNLGDETCTAHCSWGYGLDGELPAGVERGTCTLTDCSTSTAYRCAPGYYGNPTATDLTCAPCPIPGTSAPSKSGTFANRAITNCYIPSGNTGIDSLGIYEITGGNCYYTTDE